MKEIRNLLSFLLVAALFFVACKNEFEELLSKAPTNIDGVFSISSDNTGTLTVVPTGENVIKFRIKFGDVDSEEPTEVTPGQSVSHVYAEGDYVMTITGIGADDTAVDATKDVIIRFDPPENLVAGITTSNRTITVAPTADGATLFEVFFGDVQNEEATVIMPNESKSHVYETVGDYNVRIVAKGAGAATIEVTEAVTITESVSLPVDFEAADITFNFGDFGGAATALADNPSIGGINTSAKAIKSTKTAGAEVWAGTALELSGPIDFSTLKNFKAKVYSPKSGIVIKMKLENAADANINHEVDVVNTKADEWEELIWDFSGIDVTKEYSKIILFFDFGVAGDGSDYFFDDVEQTNDTPVKLELPVDFENQNINYSFTNFGNAFSTVIENPEKTGINSSSTVAQLEKASGAEVWAGSFLEFPDAMDFSASTNFKVKVWSPKAGITVRLKIENKDDNTVFHEVDGTVTGANTWEELTFDMSGADMTKTYHKAVVFMDFGVAGDGSKYYYDDMSIGDISMDVLELPLDFESTSVSYSFVNFGNATTTVADNPNASGINLSSKVGKTDKANGAEVWAGGFLELPSPIDFSGSKNFKVKVWSPKSGITVKLKVENAADGGIAHEIDVVNTMTDAWEELNFDFSGIDVSKQYHKVVIFFDFGNAGDGSTYYFDDIRLEDQLNLPLTFESSTLNYNFVNFGNVTTTVVNNPDASGINTTSKVAESDKANGAEVWGGGFIELPDAIDFSTMKKFKVKVWSPKSGITIKLKVENATDGGIAHEIDVVNTVANGWEELTYDFSAIDVSKTYHKVVIFFDFGTAGDGTKYYFDDIQQAN